MTGRLRSAVLAAMCATTLTACTVTLAGKPVKSPADPNRPIVALMDTGSYPTTMGPVPGNAGSDRSNAARAEVERMASSVVGPWQVDTALVTQDFLASAKLTQPFNVSAALSYPFVEGRDWSQPLADAAATHGFIAGLSTGRTGEGNTARLQNAVLRFGDPAAAAAAAAALAAVTPMGQIEAVSVQPEPSSTSRPLDSPWQPGACADYATSSIHPQFATSANLGDRVVLRAFTTHAAYVLYQLVIAKPVEACGTVLQTLDAQIAALDRFIPTDPAKLADLPLDPSGFVWARTLWESADTRVPWSAGVWSPAAWLHFADEDPIKAAAVFNAVGLDWVSQRLTTVYRARDAAGAARLIDHFVSDTSALPSVGPAGGGVPGFPTAKCFRRSNWKKLHQALMVANQHVWWHFMCIAQAGRYAFTAFADQEQDVKRQLSAQYRILSGE